jgi:hypothetical protein
MIFYFKAVFLKLDDNYFVKTLLSVELYCKESGFIVLEIVQFRQTSRCLLL